MADGIVLPESVDGHAGTHAKPALFRRRLIIMVKEPVAGRVKTRLARDVGSATALRVYRANMAAVVRRLANDERWQTVLSVAPAPAVARRHLPPQLPRVAQSTGDIGARMQAALSAPLGPRPAAGPVVLIGSDVPTVRPAHIAEAFRLLGRNDFVFGPAADGGFWLIGQRRTPLIRDAFPRPVAWSSPSTLADCLDALAHAGVGIVDTLSDMDAAADLVRLGASSGRVILPR